MRIAIVGVGRMGRAVEAVALRRGHEVAARLGRADLERGINADLLGGACVAIEFTSPHSAAENLLKLADIGVPVVCGTTGWEERRAAVESRFLERGGALLWAANFSIGVQLYLRAAEALAAAARGLPGYEAALVETHHSAKRDAPSGTAVAIRARVHEADADRDLPITSVRVGSVPGTHSLILDGPAETIELVHTARDRGVFAEGAVHAAEWLEGRSGVFTFADALFAG